MPERSVLDLILRSKKQGSGAKEAQKELLSFKGALQGMLGVASGVLTATAGIGVAMKKAFDLGEQGAAVTQTTQSFAGLLEKLDVAPTLLEDLRTASRETISDMGLMSSTLTLAAGASDELGRAMLNASPQLLEIAKAANKLNPTLGSTAFLYESITTGIKRGSPLILDNLGLVISIGKANEAYAASLGKTARQLTVEEQKMALLSAVTKEAGQNLLAQAGGADSATDSFARLDASMENLANTTKVLLAPSLATSAIALELLLTSTKRVNVALADHEAEMRSTAPTYDDYINEMLRAEVVARRLTQSYADKILATQLAGEQNLMHIGTLEKLGLATRDVFLATRDSGAAMDGWLAAIQNAGPAAELFASASNEIALSEEQIATNSREAAQRLDELYGATLRAAGAIDVSLTGSIQRFRDELAFVMGGGLELQRMFEDVQEAALDGALTPEQADQFLKELFIASQDLQVDLGEITATEAAENIRSELGGSLREAKTRLDEIDAGLDRLARAIEIDISYNMFYNPPHQLPGHQFGAQWQVGGVPGPDRNLVMFRASKRETITVTPEGGVPPAGGGGVHIGEISVSVGQGANGRQIVDEMMAEISRRVSVASASGAAFVGG